MSSLLNASVEILKLFNLIKKKYVNTRMRHPYIYVKIPTGIAHGDLGYVNVRKCTYVSRIA